MKPQSHCMQIKRVKKHGMRHKKESKVDANAVRGFIKKASEQIQNSVQETWSKKKPSKGSGN